MKKIVLSLFVLLLVGCSGQIKIESKPSVPPVPPAPPRLVWGPHASNYIGPYINIIKDTENDIEYLCVRDSNGIAICPMIKKEVKAEHE